MKQGNQELTGAKRFFNGLGILCYDIVPPINSDVYCVKSKSNQWAAFKIGVRQPIVPFGRYLYMWGYDRGYCLVSVVDEDKMTFANRGIINAQGVEVIKPYTFGGIFSFYGKNNPLITALTLEGSVINISIVSLKLL